MLVSTAGRGYGCDGSLVEKYAGALDPRNFCQMFLHLDLRLGLGSFTRSLGGSRRDPYLSWTLTRPSVEGADPFYPLQETPY
jgi:hypothetical protein